jgi:hypothetical protein
MPSINREITMIVVRSDRIETLNIIRFYRICRICDILNEVFES